jgi:hypothetical protein
MLSNRRRLIAALVAAACLGSGMALQVAVARASGPAGVEDPGEAGRARDGRLAPALVSAWCAHDPDAVAALFAAAATVEQVGATVGLEHAQQGADGADPAGAAIAGARLVVDDVFGAELRDGGVPAYDGRSVTWATNQAEVRAWASRFLAAGTFFWQSAAAPPAAPLTWEYAVLPGPELVALAPGAPAITGTASAIADGDQIVALVLTSDPASVVERRDALQLALNAVRAQPPLPPAAAWPPAAAPAGDTQGRTGATATRWLVASVLSVAAAAAGTAAPRRP